MSRSDSCCGSPKTAPCTNFGRWVARRANSASAATSDSSQKYYRRRSLKKRASGKISNRLVWRRVHELGWSESEARELSPRKKSLAAKARAAGLPPFTVYSRIRHSGMTEDEALSMPISTEPSLVAKARAAGLNPTTVYARIRAGWSEKDALYAPPYH